MLGMLRQINHQFTVIDISVICVLVKYICYVILWENGFESRIVNKKNFIPVNMPENWENQGNLDGQTTLGNLGNLTTKCLKNVKIKVAAKEYSTYTCCSCFALMSTFVGHSEDPGEATLVEQHVDQLLDSREVGRNRNSM
jgi:hypothetical protein